MSAGVHGDGGSFGRMPGPCPECGQRTLHQSVAMEGDRAIVVRRCSYRHCGAEWVDGTRSNTGAVS